MTLSPRTFTHLRTVLLKHRAKKSQAADPDRIDLRIWLPLHPTSKSGIRPFFCSQVRHNPDSRPLVSFKMDDFSYRRGEAPGNPGLEKSDKNSVLKVALLFSESKLSKSVQYIEFGESK